MITSFANRQRLFQLFFIVFHFLQEVLPVVAFAQMFRTVFLHEISMLFNIIDAQMVSVEQICCEHGSVVDGLIIIRAFIDADLDADAALIAAVFSLPIACLVADLIIRQMVVDLVVVDSIMPGRFVFPLFIVVEKSVVIGGSGAGRIVAGLVDNDPFDVALDAGPSGEVFGDQVGMHRYSADFFGINGLRLAMGAAADEEDDQRQKDSQRDVAPLGGTDGKTSAGMFMVSLDSSQCFTALMCFAIQKR